MALRGLAILRCAACAAAAAAAGCAHLPPAGGGRGIEAAPFGVLADGRAVTAYTLSNGAGMQARILDYGGIVQSLRVPDRHGRPGEVALGFDTLDDYVRRSPYFGAIVGRYAGRIAFGRFALEDRTEVRLPVNFGRHHLHGGPSGFDKAVWAAETRETAEGPQLILRHVSPDGDQGYPGRLDVRCEYTLTRANVLRIRFEAVADRPTPVNLTHHGYFNLGGAGVTNVLAHTLAIAADRVAETDSEQIPTGVLLPVDGTPFDLRTPHPIGEGLASAHPLLAAAGGYNHGWVLRPGAGEAAAVVRDPVSGRTMEVYTTQPSLQFYLPDFGGGMNGRAGERYTGRGAVCLETQHLPDSPNRPEFPPTVLRPGATYAETIEYRFGADR